MELALQASSIALETPKASVIYSKYIFRIGHAAGIPEGDYVQEQVFYSNVS